MFVSEELHKKLRSSSGVEKVLNFLDNMPWTYSHVGTELRLDTTRSPFLKPNADVSCCDDLEGYLHLVDGFLASNCPFRSNAKRSLFRLLNEQKVNVKRLYMSKGKDLRLSLEKNRNSMSSCLHKVYVFIAQVVFHISSISSLVFQINYEVTFKNIYFFHFTTS
ncbi:hypothetical protein Leryth_017899 [Lithospermum erythrorhizon]|nr:hypothetical protein Leryth_017899 [Lithospermum erythrorhizon]